MAQRPDDVLDLLRDGTKRARRLTADTLEAVRDGLGVFTLAA
ncbi:hypothetical protein [Methylobacterium sp. Leaf123]|nr:hypothetical protein [Methylobacterium sp. Leaf123]